MRFVYPFFMMKRKRTSAFVEGKNLQMSIVRSSIRKLCANKFNKLSVIIFNSLDPMLTPVTCK